MSNYYFTSESVTSGHPDKVCDRISDAILDELLRADKKSRVACETVVKDNTIIIVGEITTTAAVDYEAVARKTVDEIGYTEDCGFFGKTANVTVMLREQSPDIAMGVDDALEEKEGISEAQNGAGDQGMMFGFACDETPELMPLPISLAHRLCKRLETVRKSAEVDFLRPDGKAQVTVEYSEKGEPLRIEAVVVSTQHTDKVSIEKLREAVKKLVIDAVLPKNLLDGNTKYFINPTGRFVIGGPVGDSGLTGRKIIVDTYGGYSRHGGGCFSGKDPTKVDRSAAYMARYIAKNIVAAKLAKKCEVQLAYAIGVASPVSVLVETFGSETVPRERIEAAVMEVFDMRPSAIIKELHLLEPIYKSLSSYGHVGREDLGVTWERLDKVNDLIAAVK